MSTDPGRGGYRYDWNQSSSDNSITQWPVAGIEAAEVNWDIVAPDFFQRELERWLNYSQSSSGAWGYTRPGEIDNPAKAGGWYCRTELYRPTGHVLEDNRMPCPTWTATGTTGATTATWATGTPCMLS